MTTFYGSKNAKWGGLFPEGTYKFKIKTTYYDHAADTVTLSFITKNGEVFNEKFFLCKKDGQRNKFKVDQILRIFMFAFDIEGLDSFETDELPKLIGRYIQAEVVHETFNGIRTAHTAPFSYKTIQSFDSSGQSDEDDDEDFYDDDDN